MMVSLHIDGNSIKRAINEELNPDDAPLKTLWGKRDDIKKKVLEKFYFGYIQPWMTLHDTGSYATPGLMGIGSHVGPLMPTHTYTQKYSYKLKDGTVVEKEKEYHYKYERSGYFDLSAHHGIKRDAVEHRPKGNKSYFSGVFARETGLDYDDISGQGIFDNLLSEAERIEFLEYVVELVTNACNSSRKRG